MLARSRWTTVAAKTVQLLDYCFRDWSFRPCKCTFCTRYARQELFTVWYFVCDAVRKYMYSAFNCVRFLFFFGSRAKRFPFRPKNQLNFKSFGTTIIWYNHARQAESRGIDQTMESRVRYGTHTRLHVVLCTSRVPLLDVLCQPSECMDDDTTRGTSILHFAFEVV